MDNSKWRGWAKVVAYVDVVLLCLSLLGVLILVFLSAGYTAAGDDVISKNPDVMAELDSNGVTKDDVKTVLTVAAWLLLLMVVLCAIQVGIEMWAAFKLLSAAEIGKEPIEALGNARIWRNVKIVFLVLTSFGGIGVITTSMFGWIVIDLILIWRVGGLVVVCNYINELEDAVTGRAVSVGNSYPVNVVVKH